MIGIVFDAAAKSESRLRTCQAGPCLGAYHDFKRASKLRLSATTITTTTTKTLLLVSHNYLRLLISHAMQSIRSSLPMRALQWSAAPRSIVVSRPLSSTSQLRSAESHGDHYNPPGGWLFGVKPGERQENEGWEKVFYWGFFGSMAFGVIGYCYKPDTRCVTMPMHNHSQSD